MQQTAGDLLERHRAADKSRSQRGMQAGRRAASYLQQQNASGLKEEDICVWAIVVTHRSARRWHQLSSAGRPLTACQTGRDERRQFRHNRILVKQQSLY